MIKENKADKEERLAIAASLFRYGKWKEFLNKYYPIGFIWEKGYKVKKIQHPVTLSKRYTYWKDII